jgi:holo-[acyl-carrier protein] synthase
MSEELSIFRKLFFSGEKKKFPNLQKKSIVFQNGPAIVGIGIDLVDIPRIEKLYRNSQAHFLRLVFTEDEQNHCLKQSRPWIHLAARFAAKEAIAKAFKTGIGENFSWKSASILNDPSGAPTVFLDDRTTALLKKLGGSRVLISLTHTRLLAQAMAVIVR